jgi:hypothetical protein
MRFSSCLGLAWLLAITVVCADEKPPAASRGTASEPVPQPITAEVGSEPVVTTEAPVVESVPLVPQENLSPIPLESLPPAVPQKEPMKSERVVESTPSNPVVEQNQGFKITKVHEVRNDESYKSGDNKALEFEQKYWNYGAVTEQQKKDRRGHYFVFSWAAQGTASDVTARFEYRQSKSKEKIRVLEVQYPTVNGSERASYSVVGDAYAMYGPVYSWRFTLLRGGQVVAEKKSFVW